MNKKLSSLLISLITLFFLVEFLRDSSNLLKVFFNTFKLCIDNLFPSIFIFFLITDILNNYNFPYYLSKAFGKITKKIYHLPEESVYIIFMSMTSGFPGNSKLIKEQLDNGVISEFEATKLLTMTHFSNPLFIVNSVGINFFHDKKIGLVILFSHFITNFIIGFLFKKIYRDEQKETKYRFHKPRKLIDLLKFSFSNTFNILLNVFGIIIFFALITATLNKYLNLSSFSNVLFNGLIEITNGLKQLSLLNLPKIKAATLATFFISFGGFSIHMQVITILSKYKTNYYVYLLSRIIHAGISSLITLLILCL